MKARNLTNRRSTGTPSKLVALFGMIALAGTAGCAMEALPEDEAETQSSQLVQEQDQQVDDAEFDEAESASDEATPSIGAHADDPTPVPWHEEDPALKGNASDPTPQPWDVRIVDSQHAARSEQSK